MKKMKVMSLFAAALMIFSTASAVGAADYAADPHYPLPVIPGFGGSAPTGQQGTLTPSITPSSSGSSSGTGSNASVATVISDRTVTAAIKRGTAIRASYNKAFLKASSMAALAKSKGAVLKIATARYNIEIDADSVTEAKDIDLAMRFTRYCKDKDTNKVCSYCKERGIDDKCDRCKRSALIIRTAQSGDYGCTVRMSIPSKIYKQTCLDESKASVYKINSKTKKYVKVSDIEIDKNGNIVFEITDGGTYVIL